MKSINEPATFGVTSRHSKQTDLISTGRALVKNRQKETQGIAKTGDTTTACVKASSNTTFSRKSITAKTSRQRGPEATNFVRNSEMAGMTGLEPATFGVTSRHSNQLSYTPQKKNLQEIPQPHPRPACCQGSCRKNLKPPSSGWRFWAFSKERFKGQRPALKRLFGVFEMYASKPPAFSTVRMPRTDRRKDTFAPKTSLKNENACTFTSKERIRPIISMGHILPKHHPPTRHRHNRDICFHQIAL